MAYPHPQEPKFFCPECNRNYGLSDQKVLYGLFSNGKLIKCSECFEKLKHEFWLKQVAEDKYQ